jgi:hypothetical protein
MGTMTSLILGGLAIGASAYAIRQASSGARKTAAQQPAVMPMPQPPKVETAAAQATVAAKAKKRAIARSRSIYTSPLGIGVEAQIARKTLLGQ